jgi:hypothetical protein
VLNQGVAMTLRGQAGDRLRQEATGEVLDGNHEVGMAPEGLQDDAPAG